ncbi:O-fucosyltransferase family protein [Striga hermonthica]|uniref:O-fucosyltransferase family protein n=1 Tax=Striga hermonthica TaxID=68872 RepID=A0A9N7MWV1_STRHE|nr:O-fucosyltransferase family protein [Striga hermonthica]
MVRFGPKFFLLEEGFSQMLKNKIIKKGDEPSCAEIEHNEASQSSIVKLAYSPKRATAELRHSSSIGSRSTSSPSAASVAPSPLSADHHSSAAEDDDDDNGRDRYSRDRSFRSYFQPFLPQYFSPNDDLYRPHPHRSKISILVLIAVVFTAVISVSSVVKRLNAPYLCKKDGITLQCPHVKETPSLWENPYSATTSWKPCAERREGIISENMADLLVSRMRNRTGSSNPFMALHLRFEKGMVGLSFCDFVGTRMEKALMALYRLKEWPRRFKDGSHLWALALQKRKEGRCPLEPGEVAVMLRGMGYPKETQIYVASGQVYGGQNRMAPLRNMFPNLVTKEELANKFELDSFKKHVTSLAALDFLVCLKSDVFVMTHGGNFAKLIIGHRRYLGHRQKSIKPDKGLMSKSLGDPYMGWATFVEDVMATHETRTGLPEETFPNYDIWENPLTPCNGNFFEQVLYGRRG